MSQGFAITANRVPLSSRREVMMDHSATAPKPIIRQAFSRLSILYNGRPDRSTRIDGSHASVPTRMNDDSFWSAGSFNRNAWAGGHDLGVLLVFDFLSDEGPHITFDINTHRYRRTGDAGT
ncbi:hypothetical protein LMTR13_25570 [Bradyrhizobium icense]|uniref:Uncharacterized protein n=1 Tax=Bradyrhizobium icense TaxID=1274631 RepID=A0A1B1UJS7_9BRAD|nr:hypothetical protein LMTR13_25570 [Bradyrhizobium icense]